MNLKPQKRHTINKHTTDIREWPLSLVFPLMMPGMSWTKKQKSKFKTVIKTVVFKFKTQVVGVFFITLFFILTA
jgi:hypothetical protein